MKDGPESAEGVRTASSAINGGGTNNGDLRDKARTIKQVEGSPTTLLAVGAEEVTAGDNALPLGGTLTLLDRSTETNQNAAASPDTNGDDTDKSSTNSKSSDGKSDKVFRCRICDRTFGYRHVLQNHERTHTGEKPFECPQCHKRFTRDHHLKTHIRLHTGEKPYQCSYCDRHFAQVANLRRHLRTHTGERPYACQNCTSKFSDSNQLKSHMLIHRGEKPFQCTECLGKFRRRHHLNHHKCPKDKANIGKPRRGRRPRAYDELIRVCEEDDPDALRISENDEEDGLRHDSHSPSETECNQNAQVVPIANNGRKANNAIRILTHQQRELFLRDKVSMQTQAIDMRVTTDVPMRTVIVPRTTRFVEGVLDLSNSRSDSEIEPIDEEVQNIDDAEDDLVDVVNGDIYDDINGDKLNGDSHNKVNGDIRDKVNGDINDKVNGDIHDKVNGDSIHYDENSCGNRHIRHLRNFAIRRTNPSPTVLMNHRPTVLVGKLVEPLNGSCSSNGNGIEDHHIQINGNGGHYISELDDRRTNNGPLSHPFIPESVHRHNLRLTSAMKLEKVP